MSPVEVDDAVWEGWAYLLGVLPMALVALPFIGYARTQRLQAFGRDPRLAALGLFFLLYGLASVVQSGGVVAVYIGDEGPGFQEAVRCVADEGNGTMRCTQGAPPAFGASPTAASGPWPAGAPANGNGTAGEPWPGGPDGNGTGNGTWSWAPGEGRRIDRIFTVPVQRMWPFWLHHGLALAALAAASFAYLRPASLEGNGHGSVAPAVVGIGALPTIVVASAILQTAEALLALVPAVLAAVNWRRRRTPGSLQVAAGFALLAASHLAALAVVVVRPLVLVPVFDLLALAGIATLVLAVPRGP